MSLSITTEYAPAGTTVRVSGEVDVSCAGEMRDAIDSALAAAEPASDLTVDIADVPYIDSTGIGVLVGAAHRASESGVRLVVARPQRNVARVLGLLGVGDDLHITEG